MYDGRCAGMYEKDMYISYDFDEHITVYVISFGMNTYMARC